MRRIKHVAQQAKNLQHSLRHSELVSRSNVARSSDVYVLAPSQMLKRVQYDGGAVAKHGTIGG